MVLLFRATAMATRRPILPLAACCSLVLAAALSGCGTRPGADGPAKPPRQLQAESAAAAARRQKALERCRAGRDALLDSLAALRREEVRLATIRAERFAPEPPPPAFDETAAARLTREDAELDRERHESALSQWRERNAQQQSAWQAGQARRLSEAQAALDRRAAALQARHPRLFTGPGSIEVVPDAVARLSRCEPPPPPPQKQASR